MLRESKGNMYDWVTHTWNTIKGECPHNCSYCYMKRWGKQKLVHFDEKELKTDLGKDNFIFVGSSCDMFAEDVPIEWIKKTIEHCNKYDNKYLLQTKNPDRLMRYLWLLDDIDKYVVCTTIETNRWYEEIMNNCPHPKNRANQMNEIAHTGIKTYVTIEPVIDFDLDEMVYLIETCLPTQVNIGADTGNHNLPEPDQDKIQQLITELSQFTKVKPKKNLKRILQYV